MMLRLSIIMVVLGLAMPAARAQRGGDGSGPRPGGALLHRDLDAVAERLELTDEQKEKLAEIRAGFEKDTADDRKAARAVRQKMQALWTSGEIPEKAEVVALQTAMRAHFTKIADRAVDARIEALKMLTPEQRKRIAELREQARERRRGARRGRGGGRGGGD